MKKQLLIGAVIVATLCTTACGKIPELKNKEQAVVSFTDKNNSISVDTLYQELKEKYAINILIDMMDKELLNKEYPTDEEETSSVESNLNQIKSYYESYYKSYYSSFEQFLSSSYGVSDEAGLKEYLSLDYKRNKLTDDYAKKQVKDSEIEKYYKDKTIGDMKASHILIKADTNDDMSDKEVQEAEAEAKKTAEEIISKLNNGEKFEKLAKKYSDDESVDLGWFNRGDMVSAFEEACIKLNKNEYTKTPIKTEYGYHIILKTDQKDKPKLEDVKDEIIETLTEEKKNDDAAIQYEALMAFREEKGMKIEDKDLNRQYKTYMDNLITQARKQASESKEN